MRTCPDFAVHAEFCLFIAAAMQVAFQDVRAGDDDFARGAGGRGDAVQAGVVQRGNGLAPFGG